MDKISIIVPIYNVEKYLRECIDSIINQTYTNLEIILVNDGATDTSPEICEEYAAMYNNIKIVNKVNGGLSDARNAGLEQATGEYIIFTDSDDYLAPNSCEVLYNAIKDTDLEFVSANFAFTNNDGTPWKKPMFSDKFENTELSIEEYKKSFYLLNCGVWNKIFRKDFIEKNKLRFEIGLPSEDDIFVTLAFMKAKKSYYIKDVVYYYRQRDTKKGNLSISYNCSMDYFKGINKTYKIVYKNFKANKQMNFYRYYYAKRISYILYKFIDSKALTDKEKIKVLKQMKWFYDIKREIKPPMTSETLDIITEGIINEEYEQVLKYCKILSEARSYMTNEKRERMARPDYSKYNKIESQNEEKICI